MAEEVLEAEAIEEPAQEADEGEDEVRRLPARRSPAELDAWRSEARTVAIAAAGGIAAGAATVAAVNAIAARSERKQSRRLGRRARKARESIVASRSFLIDVHVLGR